MVRMAYRILILWCLVAAGSSALCQCTEGIYTQQGLCNNGIQARFPLTAGVNGQTFSIEFRGIYDPARNMTVGPANWTTIEYKTLSPGGAAGDCLKMWCTGNGSPNGMGVTVASGSFGWPTAHLAPYATGRFEIRFGYTYPAGTWHYLTFRVYKTDGTFHCEAPSPIINPPGTEDDPAVQEGKVVIRPFVFQAGDPQEDVNVYLRGAKSSDGITGSDGSVRFVDTGTGTFRVVVSGYSETGKKLQAEMTFAVNAVKVWRPLFFFDANGGLLGSALGDDEIGGDPGVTPDVLSTLLQALFVPSEETVQGLFRGMDELFNWGPLAYIVLVKDLVTQDPPGGMTLQDYLQMAPVQWDPVTLRWSRGTGNAVTIVNLAQFEDEQNTGGWVVWIRWALAMSVYVSFGFVIVKIFTPVHTV